MLACAMAAFSVISCKKNNSEETKLYLNGAVTISEYPIFSHAEDTLTVYVSGVTHPDGKALGLIRKFLNKTDTVYRAGVDKLPEKAAVGLRMPDSLASFTINIYVYPIDGDVYYSSSASFGITTVDENLSIPETAYDPYEMEGGYQDPRDLHEYNVYLSDKNCWLKGNMSYCGTSESPCGTPYYNSSAVAAIFGGFYTYEEAKKVCPENWHLPSNEEWMELANSVMGKGTYSEAKADFDGVAGKLMVDAYFNGDRMWEFWPGVDIPKEYTESALKVIPVGYYNAATKETFNGMLDYACFWTSDAYEADDTQAYYRYIYKKENTLKLGNADKKSMAMSVRCVKER